MKRKVKAARETKVAFFFQDFYRAIYFSLEVVWFCKYKILKMFIIIIIKDNNKIAFFLFFTFSLHTTISFMPPPTN
jgi:hypothetical protein